MAKEKLIIYGRLSNLNDYTKACRTNKYAGAECKKNNEKIVSEFIGQQLADIKFKGKVRLDFIWVERDKKRDLDNICFAKKFILDALVKNQIIQTDDWKGVEGFTDSFLVDKDNPRIEVIIEGSKE